MVEIQKEQFADCVGKYGRLVFSICLSFTGNYFDAEDLAQDTFLSAYKSLPGFEGENIKAYLTTIAANKCRDHLRRSERKNIPLDYEERENPGYIESGPEDDIVKSESYGRVMDVCEKLNEPYRSVAVSYFCGGKKLSDISKQTGQNLKTLQTQLYRAKAWLKILWEEESK